MNEDPELLYVLNGYELDFVPVQPFLRDDPVKIRLFFVPAQIEIHYLDIDDGA